MRIPLSFDFAPELLDIMTSLIPALLHISGIGIITTMMLVVIVGFNITALCNPSLDGSPRKANTFSDFFFFDSLFSQCYDLLVTLIPLRLVCRVGLSIRSYMRRERLYRFCGNGHIHYLPLFSDLCPAMGQRFLHVFC